MLIPAAPELQIRGNVVARFFVGRGSHRLPIVLSPRRGSLAPPPRLKDATSRNRRSATYGSTPVGKTLTADNSVGLASKPDRNTASFYPLPPMHYLVLAKAGEPPKELPQLFHPLVLAVASEDDVVLAVDVGLEDV